WRGPVRRTLYAGDSSSDCRSRGRSELSASPGRTDLEADGRRAAGRHGGERAARGQRAPRQCQSRAGQEALDDYEAAAQLHFDGRKRLTTRENSDDRLAASDALADTRQISQPRPGGVAIPLAHYCIEPARHSAVLHRIDNRFANALLARQ